MGIIAKLTAEYCKREYERLQWVPLVNVGTSFIHVKDQGKEKFHFIIKALFVQFFQGVSVPGSVKNFVALVLRSNIWLERIFRIHDEIVYIAPKKGHV